MKNIVLISCVSKKLDQPSKAKNLYVSPLFQMNLRYAQTFKPEKIFILSAKYGLVSLDEVIEPYNVTLNNMSAAQKKEWANQIVSQLREECDLDDYHFIFLAGNNYRKYLLPKIKSFEIPMEGLPIGKQLQFLKREISNE